MSRSRSSTPSWEIRCAFSRAWLGASRRALLLPVRPRLLEPLRRLLLGAGEPLAGAAVAVRAQQLRLVGGGGEPLCA
ncbi:MAG: hypothetical protein ACYCUM_11600 [Solirubrobacteraceae bacterium]